MTFIPLDLIRTKTLNRVAEDARLAENATRSGKRKSINPLDLTRTSWLTQRDVFS